MSYYIINKVNEPVFGNAIWNKPVWQNIESLIISNNNNWKSCWKPHTEVKSCYDDKNLYLIFYVKDQFVKCETNKHNGPVWEDSCVEFFFSPGSADSRTYFNIEINCCGFAYMAFQRDPKIDYDLFSIEDIEASKINYSLKRSVVNEIKSPQEWVIEYKLPFDILNKYFRFQYPEKGAIWRGNFFKCAENNSQPHWLSWTNINNPIPDFHLPQYMGKLKFN